MLKLAVLVSGSGTNLQSIIDAIEDKKLSAEISVVITDNAEAKALERAAKHKIPSKVISKDVYPDKEAYDEALTQEIKSHDVELIAMAGFMRILTPLFIKSFPLRIMNIHPSLLPSFPGLGVQEKALNYGARFTGATVHFVDEGVDTGPIIIQAVVPIRDTDTLIDLKDRILLEEHRIYPQAIQFFSEARIEVEGRIVKIKDAARSLGSLENPRVTLYQDF
jgi:phosphoribosylglycinamide formyltransferase-1